MEKKPVFAGPEGGTLQVAQETAAGPKKNASYIDSRLLCTHVAYYKMGGGKNLEYFVREVIILASYHFFPLIAIVSCNASFQLVSCKIASCNTSLQSKLSSDALLLNPSKLKERVHFKASEKDLNTQENSVSVQI